MRRLVIVPVFSLLASCAEKPPVSTSAASSKAAPAPKLIETPGAKLGTAPSGFGLDVGTQAPDVSLPDISGRTQHLGELYAQGRTLVIFYRGGWCPFCNLQLHDFSVAKPQFDARGVAIVAISVDKPSEQARTQAKQGVPFPMLSDPKLVAHQAYRVVHVPGDEERRALDEYHLDLAAYSGESHGNFAVPAIFLVDRGGTIRFVHIDEDYTTRPSARQMLEVVDRIPTAK
jgi:peroxiredoxin